MESLSQDHSYLQSVITISATAIINVARYHHNNATMLFKTPSKHHLSAIPQSSIYRDSTFPKGGPGGFCTVLFHQTI